MALAVSSGRELDGLWIGAQVPHDTQVTESLRRVEEALGLIRTHDPRRYRRLQVDLSRIWVRVLPNACGNYSRQARACQLDVRFVLDETIDTSQIASVIVHEAIHARIDSRGIEYREALRQRIECACVRQELRFAERVPGALELRRRKQEWLDAPSDPEYWTDSAWEQRRARGIHESMLYLGIPLWVRGPLAVLGRVQRAIRRLRRRRRLASGG